MPIRRDNESAEKAKKLLAWALTERLEEPPEKEEDIILPGYTVKEALGKGGMGTVYRAIHQGLNRTVAIKIFKPKAADRDLFVERLKREGKLMAKLKHPNVLAIYSASVMEDGTPYLVLEYVKGEDLQQKLQNEFTINPRAALRIAIKVCEGLSAVHKLGIIHRDIKPGNVLLGKNGSVKVTDFGVSKDLKAKDQATSLTMTGTTVGTADYMSPEQTRNEELTPRSDLYSLGVLLYEMLMGVTPRGKFQPLSKAKVPKKLELLILRCLQQDPLKRPASADTLAQALRKIYHALHQRKHNNYKTLALCAIGAISSILLVAYVSTKNPNNTQTAAPEEAPWELDGTVGEWSSLTHNKSHTQDGEWWTDSNTIYTQEMPNAKYFFSYSPGYSYTFYTEYSRIYGEGNVGFFLPTNRGLALYEIDLTEAHLTGFHKINNQDLTQQERSDKFVIETGEIYQIEIVVNTNEITASIDGKIISKLDLMRKRFSVPDHWGDISRIPFKLGFGSNSQSNFRNTKIKRDQ